MLYSMTGYGKVTEVLGSKVVSVEIKSLNSKYLDLNLRLPHLYRSKEIELRQWLANQRYRGKVDLQIVIEEDGESQAYKINHKAVIAYVTELKILSKQLEIPTESIWPAVLRIPDTTQNDKGELTAEEWKAIKALISATIEQFTDFRANEGAALNKDLVANIAQITDNLIEIKLLAPERIERIKKRIRQSLLEVAKDFEVDNNRFEQELVYYLEKLDINEEVVRLGAHCERFLEVLVKKGATKGKKLNFISQEIGREINTMGAKANDANIQKFVVEMKEALDKIKEQIMNIV